jgi:hypothetical protein
MLLWSGSDVRSDARRERADDREGDKLDQRQSIAGARPGIKPAALA